MKLLVCLKCSDVFSLSIHEWKTCACKTVSGAYVDQLNAEVQMPDRSCGVVLGFANGSIGDAIYQQVQYGDSTQTMRYGLQHVTKGRDFAAFVIPESADSVKRHYTGE